MFTENNPPKSICILRLSAIGDVTHVIPVIDAIKKQWPAVNLTWICGSLEYKLLSCLPNIRFIVFNKNAGLAEYFRIKKQLAGECFDVLLHMQVAARANLLSMLIRADFKLGWDKASSRDLHQMFINRRIKPAKNRHQVQTFLEFARALGVEVKEPVWNFPIPEEAVEFAYNHLNLQRKALLISPCSSHQMRNWKIKSYAHVADYAIEQLDMQVILSGGPGNFEKTMGKKIVQAMKHRPLNLIGQDTLIQSLALLKAVDVVISPDSGPLHMANAMGTKVLGLYACTNPIRSGPYHSLDCCVNKFPQAVEKFAHTTVDKMRWGKKIEQPGVMELIKVEEVIEKLRQIVQ